MIQTKNTVKELSKNDWVLHKNLIIEGIIPNDFAKIIQNDEIVKLHEISSLEDFDFIHFIHSPLYERCDFINPYHVKLIKYAAFFGSIKCFEYLLVNGSDIKNIGKYAIASSFM